MRRKDLEQQVIQVARNVISQGKPLWGAWQISHRLKVTLADALAELDKVRTVERPRTGANSPVTSHQAAKWISHAEQMTMIHEIFYRIYWTARNGVSEHGGGRTTDELEEQMGKSHQSVSPRVNELLNAGWITDSGFKRRTRNGTEAIVWKPSDAAFQAVKDSYEPEVVNG